MNNEKITIEGKVKYQDIEMGFWGITTASGENFRPVNMPEQLKVDGANVSCEAKILKYHMDIFMWGQAVEIVSFVTPSYS